MSGDILNILANSEAKKSLVMEADISNYFRKRHWESVHGKYYKDVNTLKIREIDVFATKFFSSSRNIPADGVPLVNIDIVCECK